MKRFAILGAGSYGREVIPILKEQVRVSGLEGEVVFVDDNLSGTTVNGFSVVSTEDFINSPHKDKYFNVAIADDKIRKKAAEVMLCNGVEPITIRHPNTVVYDTAQIHNSAILSPFVTVSANAIIGEFFHANIYSYVAHDCIIGNYVTFAPGAKCNGNVIIEDHVYVGSGAVIKQGTPRCPVVIESGAVIGMGAIVTKSVKSGITVCGNPARELTKLGMK